MDLWSVCRPGPKLACRRRKGTAEGPLSCRSHCRHQLATAVQEARCSTQWLQGGTGGASMQCTQRIEGAAQLAHKGTTTATHYWPAGLSTKGAQQLQGILTLGASFHT